MKKLLLSAGMLALMGQGCLLRPAQPTQPTPTKPITAPTPIPAPEPTPTPEPEPQRSPSTFNVTIKNFVYVQSSITVKKGDKVVFQNNDSVGHSATADGGAFDTGIISGGSSATLDTSTLAAGTYAYHCTPHPNMKGILIVQ